MCVHIIAVRSVKIVVAPNAAGSIKIPGFTAMVVDNRMGIMEWLTDVRKGVFTPGEFHTVLLMLGRYDVLCNRSATAVLERWLEVTQEAREAGTRFILTGPVPRAHDKPYLIKDFESVWQCWKAGL